MQLITLTMLTLQFVITTGTNGDFTRWTEDSLRFQVLIFMTISSFYARQLLKNSR